MYQLGTQRGGKVIPMLFPPRKTRVQEHSICSLARIDGALEPVDEVWAPSAHFYIRLGVP
jgi:hypothetical protein